MIRYAAERYGRDHVAQIVTFSTIKARAAVRDAARVLGYPYLVGDKVAKAMPPLVMGRDTPLYACLEEHEKFRDGYRMAVDLRRMYADDDDAHKVIEVAKGLEGLRRQDGIHAAAVVITKDALTDYLPIQRKPEAGQDPEQAPVVTQYEMGGVEELGLLKMDFLGLRNLDVITDTLELIRRTRGVELDIDDASLADEATFALLSPRRHHRGVPAGVATDEGAAPSPRSELLRGRVGRSCALPPGSDEREHALRLRRPQERSQAGAVLPSRCRGAAGRHLRADDLPGVGDAGVATVRRLLAGRGRQPPQGVRQEEARAHGDRTVEVHRRMRAHRLRAGPRHPAVRRHRTVRRLCVQQEPYVRIRAHHLPNGVSQDALPGGVPGGPAHQRQNQPREGGDLPQ